MAHGSPDWGTGKPTTTIYQLSDLGELAARLGSINTFDRRGDVIWFDDFEENLAKWQTSATGTGAWAALSTDYSRSGAMSAKLTTGDTANQFTFIVKRLGLSALETRFGLEFSVQLHNFARLYAYLQIYREGWIYTTAIRYDPATGVLEYYSSTPAWVALTAALALKVTNCWHTIKLVQDQTALGDYTRLLVDNQNLDVAGIACHRTETDVAEHMMIWIQSQAVLNSNSSMYIDDVILTQNEP